MNINGIVCESTPFKLFRRVELKTRSPLREVRGARVHGVVIVYTRLMFYGY